VDSASSLPCSVYTTTELLPEPRASIPPSHTPDLQSVSMSVSHVVAFGLSDCHSVRILHLPCACYMHCLAPGSAREPVMSAATTGTQYRWHVFIWHRSTTCCYIKIWKFTWHCILKYCYDYSNNERNVIIHTHTNRSIYVRACQRCFVTNHSSLFMRWWNTQ
jgi:hypothetical protein